MAKPQTASERFRMQMKEQARVTAETQQQNSELIQQVNILEGRLDTERADMQESINMERAEREELEKMLHEERAAREKWLEAETRSRQEFERKMAASFKQQMAKLVQEMGIQQQVITVICLSTSKIYFAYFHC